MSGGRTTRSLWRVRNELMAERGRIQQQASAAAAVMDLRTWQTNGDDQADVASTLVECAGAAELAGLLRRRVADIDAALARIEAGTYGICEVCGEPIDSARLDALPFAVRCVADQQQVERLA